MKMYMVFMQDEYNNNYYLGMYKELIDALPDINEWLSTYNAKLDTISEYASTFNMCFDTPIYTDDENVVWVRGFILYDSDLQIKECPNK